MADYGYQWWVIKPGVFSALVHDGQYIIVVPEENIVAVFTSSLIARDTWAPMGLLFTYILPALESTTSLSQNAKMNKTLNRACACTQAATHYILIIHCISIQRHVTNGLDKHIKPPFPNT